MEKLQEQNVTRNTQEKNGMRILFKDHRISAKAITILKRHYEKA